MDGRQRPPIIVGTFTDGKRMLKLPRPINQRSPEIKKRFDDDVRKELHIDHAALT